MKILGAQSFAHGIHPPESKDDTCTQPIRQFPFAPVLAVPLVQHLGKPAIPVVREGQEVTRGQCLAQPDGFLSVAMHAPATGVIRRIGLIPSISGKMVPGFFLEPFPASTQEILEGTACDPDSASPEEIIAAIQSAGVVGLGGAAFPTHAKLRIPEGKSVDTVVINGITYPYYRPGVFTEDVSLGRNTIEHDDATYILDLKHIDLSFPTYEVN